MPVHDSALAASEVKEISLPVCRFCGANHPTIGYDGQPATNYYVVCNSCGAQGPSSPTLTGALLKYQLRPPVADAHRVGFMCLTDWDVHMEGDTVPQRIYLDEATLRADRKCVDQCGLVEVHAYAHRVVPGLSGSELKTSAKRPYKQRIKNG